MERKGLGDQGLLAKLSFYILGINAQNWKVNKCSHISEQVNKWAYEHMKKPQFVAVPNHQPPPHQN